MNEREAEIVRSEFDRCLHEWRDAIVYGRGSYVGDSWHWRAEQTLEIGAALGVVDRAEGKQRILALLRTRPSSADREDPT